MTYNGHYFVIIFFVQSSGAIPLELWHNLCKEKPSKNILHQRCKNEYSKNDLNMNYAVEKLYER